MVDMVELGDFGVLLLDKRTICGTLPHRPARPAPR